MTKSNYQLVAVKPAKVNVATGFQVGLLEVPTLTAPVLNVNAGADAQVDEDGDSSQDVAECGFGSEANADGAANGLHCLQTRAVVGCRMMAAMEKEKPP